METPEAPPEADRAGEAPHPRHNAYLYGQSAAEEAFLSAYRSGRMHHAWLLSGPRGIGKATLAWRMARFLLSQGMAEPQDNSLQMDPAHQIFRQVAALSAPGLALARRPWDEKTKRHKTAITVEEIRKLKSSFTMSAAEGRWRVAIIDAADELNVQSENALLKLLEEPPEKTALLLVAHQPSKLLPTIRSRCRQVSLAPLAPDDLALGLDTAGFPPEPDMSAMNELCGGSVGEAIRVISGGGEEIYANLMTLLDQIPRMNRTEVARLGDSATGPANAPRYDLILRLMFLALHRLATTGATGNAPPEAAPNESATLRRLSPNPTVARSWATLSQSLQGRINHGRAVNLDPSALLLDAFLQIDGVARKALS